MKKIGILGGVGWASTLEYYRLLCVWCIEHCREKGLSPPLPTPPIAIESLVMHDMRKLRPEPNSGEQDWAAYDAFIRDGLLRLQNTECQFAIIANNTMHTRLRAVRSGLTIPIVSVLDEAAKATRKSGVSRALVLGTNVTMRTNDYGQALLTQGIAAYERLEDPLIDGLQTLIDTDLAGEKATPRGKEKLLQFCSSAIEADEITFKRG